MKNPPTFRMQETSQKGQSLLVWDDADNSRRVKPDHSLQMPTEIAQYIVTCCNKETEDKLKYPNK